METETKPRTYEEQMAAIEATIERTNPKPRTLESLVTLEGIGAMIEDRHQFEQASALCLLSIARSQERIAAAAERIADCANTDLHDFAVVVTGQ